LYNQKNLMDWGFRKTLNFSKKWNLVNSALVSSGTPWTSGLTHKGVEKRPRTTVKSKVKKKRWKKRKTKRLLKVKVV